MFGSVAFRYALDPGWAAKHCITAAFLTIPVADYLFIEPQYTFFIQVDAADSISLAVFLALGIAVSIIIDQFQKTKERPRQAHLELQRSESHLRTMAATVPEILPSRTLPTSRRGA